MKRSTVGLLAAVGMTLASLLVWSLTSPAAETPDPDPSFWPVADPGAGDVLLPQADRSRFFAAGDRPGALTLEGRLGHPVLPAGVASDTYVFLEMRAGDPGDRADPVPLDVAIVVDRSGSMKGRRLRNALAAARGMVRRLRDGDTVSVVTYNTRTEVLVEPTRIDPLSRDRVLWAIAGVTAVGDTCISCGIDEGMRLVGRGAGEVHRVLLLSDGEATAGVRDVGGFRRIAGRCRDRGASITSIGVDVDYNERVMAVLAEESNGRHYFVETAEGLPRIFDLELESLVRTVAKSAEVVLDLGPGVELGHVYDRTFRREGNRLVVPLGAFSASDAKTVLAEVHVPPSPEGELAIADVRLRYSETGSGSSSSLQGTLVARVSADTREPSDLDPIVSARIGRSRTADALEEANRLFVTGRAADAREAVTRERRKLARRARSAERAAPAKRKREVARDFERQVAALDGASRGFAAPAAEPGGPRFAEPPERSRSGKAAVRRNQSVATDLAF